MLCSESSRPSNIALIKYMGKTDSAQNLPTNASLSYTLEHLRTFVAIRATEQASDIWQPLQGQGLSPIELSDKGRSRFLQHFAMLKDFFQLKGSYLIQSANNFPSDCGLASSASSFAALTAASYELARKARPGFLLADSELSELSRMGSGSSCRSFFSPWSVWDEAGARSVKFPLQGLHHQVFVVEAEKKLVSSSEAHRRVTSSLPFEGRARRASRRLFELNTALNSGDWTMAFELCWAEFFDMHALFETSNPSFGYITDGSWQVLNRIRKLWQETKDGPLVTMDAGPNVHLLYRQGQEGLAKSLHKEFSTRFAILASPGIQDTKREKS